MVYLKSKENYYPDYKFKKIRHPKHLEFHFSSTLRIKRKGIYYDYVVNYRYKVRVEDSDLILDALISAQQRFNEMCVVSLHLYDPKNERPSDKSDFQMDENERLKLMFMKDEFLRDDIEKNWI